ncbi:P1 family peptidase [Kineosporia sp. J2-2]|uniref:P1 family peptidase n=1 Tax=Kineosporia corallincola TaxID=2835133 RepID=A0ABS5TH18_9ACTN|nr:P1 family peptidase [Kineosporia corallincola]MBT0770388.1 P1 family peptidase [Kineosporia corallincola]
MDDETPTPLWGSITDVPGIRVGHATRTGDGWLTGVTAVIPPPGTVGAVDVRGGGPGTHETDALDPTTLVPTVDAVTLTGGSAFGLASAGGVQQWCLEQGLGFAAGPPSDPSSVLVPIVPAAAVFDLGRGGDLSARPDFALGHEAAGAAGTSTPRGVVGAGTGALAARGTLKGGIGTASITLPGGVVVGALVVLNALGSPLDATTGGLLGTAFVPPGLTRPGLPDPAENARYLGDLAAATAPSAANTTLAVVATNTVLDPARARRTATAAHDGLARSLAPAHTLLDGDTVFALATGEIEVDFTTTVGVQAAAADAVMLAVMDAVLAANGVDRTASGGVAVPSYRERFPSLR